MIFYAKLGVFCRDNIKEKGKAKAYFQQAEELCQALVADAPLYVEFRDNLGIVQEILKGL